MEYKFWFHFCKFWSSFLIFILSTAEPCKTWTSKLLSSPVFEARAQCVNQPFTGGGVFFFLAIYYHSEDINLKHVYRIVPSCIYTAVSVPSLHIAYYRWTNSCAWRISTVFFIVDLRTPDDKKNVNLTQIRDWYFRFINI
jgi:hypothetical protein